MDEKEQWSLWGEDPDFDNPEKRTRKVLDEYGVTAQIDRRVSIRKAPVSSRKRHYELHVAIPEKGSSKLLSELREIGYDALRKYKKRTDNPGPYDSKNQYTGYMMVVLMYLTVKIIEEDPAND